MARAQVTAPSTLATYFNSAAPTRDTPRRRRTTTTCTTRTTVTREHPPRCPPRGYNLAYATDPATGDLYAIGGLSSSKVALSSVEIYDPASDAWSAIASLPQALSGASASTDGAGHILVFGGTNSAGTPVSTVYSYTIASNSWAAVSPLPVAETGTAAVFGAYGQVYVIGGRTTAGTTSNVYIYNPVTDQWSSDAPLPTALSNVAAAIDANGNLDVIGGFNSAGAATATVYQSPALPAPVGLPVAPTIDIWGNYNVYNGAPQAATASVYASDGSTPVDGTVTFTYNGSTTVPTNAGTYSVLAYFTSNDPNYTNTVAAGTYYIAQASPTISVTGGGTITYDGQPHAIAATATGVDGATPVAGTFSYTYNGSSTVPVNPGTYAAVATFTSTDPNYAGGSASTTITIPDPTIPTGVTAVGSSTTSVTVSWNPVAGGIITTFTRKKSPTVPEEAASRFTGSTWPARLARRPRSACRISLAARST